MAGILRILLLALSAGMALAAPPPHPPQGPPSTEAAAYLDQAIAVLRANHINSAEADWPALTARARAEIEGARTPADTYPAIRHLIGALGERHSFFLPPLSEAEIEAARRAGTGHVLAGVEMPTSALIDGRVGVVRLPELNMFSADGAARVKTYQQALQTALQQLDRAPLCGWIVDLRNDGGGTMWPMLAGLDPLLGDGPFGFFVSAQGSVPWLRTSRGIASAMPTGQAPPPPAFALAHAAAPIAVLIGPRTGSSGEMTALALIGRPGVRVFGAPSAGFTSANGTFHAGRRASDGDRQLRR
jgi:carboxyl-terminal processing protease